MANRIATTCWLMASAGLVGVITLQVKSDLALTTPVTAAPNAASPYAGEEAVPIVGHLTDDVLDAIIDRPLFSISRRPFAPPVEKETVKKAPRAAQPLSVKLAGTMLSGESRMALLNHPSKGLMRLREGQLIDGWQVIEVRDDEVRLKQGDKLTLLHLRKDIARKAELPTVDGLKPATAAKDQLVRLRGDGARKAMPSRIGGPRPASAAKDQPPVGTLDGDKAAVEPTTQH